MRGDFSQPCLALRNGWAKIKVLYARCNASKVFYEEESTHLLVHLCAHNQIGALWGGILGDNPLDWRINTLDLLLLCVYRHYPAEALNCT